MSMPKKTEVKCKVGKRAKPSELDLILHKEYCTSMNNCFYSLLVPDGSVGPFMLYDSDDSDDSDYMSYRLRVVEREARRHPDHIVRRYAEIGEKHSIDKKVINDFKDKLRGHSICAWCNLWTPYKDTKHFGALCDEKGCPDWAIKGLEEPVYACVSNIDLDWIEIYDLVEDGAYVLIPEYFVQQICTTCACKVWPDLTQECRQCKVYRPLKEYTGPYGIRHYCEKCSETKRRSYWRTRHKRVKCCSDCKQKFKTNKEYQFHCANDAVHRAAMREVALGLMSVCSDVRAIIYAFAA